LVNAFIAFLGLMSGSISGFNLLLNKGLVHNFFHLWLKSWSLSWLIASDYGVFAFGS
jgi:hypothetical protein